MLSMSLKGVIEQISPVIERPRYKTAAAEEKVLVVVTGTGFKRCRNCFLVSAKNSSLHFSIAQYAAAVTALKSRSF
jgi:hypothetical protein